MTHLMARGGPPGRRGPQRAIKWVSINAPWYWHPDAAG